MTERVTVSSEEWTQLNTDVLGDYLIEAIKGNSVYVQFAEAAPDAEDSFGHILRRGERLKVNDGADDAYAKAIEAEGYTSAAEAEIVVSEGVG